MVVYDSAGIYIESQSTLRAQIKAIDDIIAALLASAVKSAAKAHLTEYSLNTGQTQIKTSLRGTKEIYESIKDFRTLKNAMKAQLNGNGRRMTFVDGKNLIGPRDF